MPSIDFAPADNRIDIDVRASEPQGGILANLLQLPGEPPVEISVTGSGPAANWSGSGTFAVDGDGHYPRRRAPPVHRSRQRDRGDGLGRVRALHAGKSASAAGGQRQLDIAATLTGAGGIEISRATGRAMR